MPSTVPSLFKSDFRKSDSNISPFKIFFSVIEEFIVLPAIEAISFKSNIDIGSLQKAWASAGYPDDTNDIAQILKKYGFDDQAIETAFVNVLGNDYNNEDGEESDANDQPSGTILKIADYIKRAGLTDEITAYMKENFGSELTAEPKQGMFKRAMNYGKNLFKRKATAEDVRHIFTNILKEERHGLAGIVKAQEQNQLGRHRK